MGAEVSVFVFLVGDVFVENVTNVFKFEEVKFTVMSNILSL